MYHHAGTVHLLALCHCSLSLGPRVLPSFVACYTKLGEDPRNKANYQKLAMQILIMNIKKSPKGFIQRRGSPGKDFWVIYIYIYVYITVPLLPPQLKILYETLHH